MTANAKKCAVVVRSEKWRVPGRLQMNWGEDGLPVVDQDIYFGVEISKTVLGMLKKAE